MELMTHLQAQVVADGLLGQHSASETHLSYLGSSSVVETRLKTCWVLEVLLHWRSYNSVLLMSCIVK